LALVEDARPMKLRAPAKVNLSLRILGKRLDGFHELESLMAPISLADEISISTGIGNSVRVVCDDPSIPQDDSNLAAVAARQFQAHTGQRFRTRIAIHKKVPSGAGLGGGSSDAAAVLVALDSLFETHLGVEGLEKIAANIGSDVPFFIRRVPSWSRGRGELITPADLPGHFTILLLKPPFGVETSAAYKRWSASIELPGVDYGPQRWRDIEFVNDLERPVFEKYPFLAVMKAWLREQPECHVGMMSGSGSTMFALCDGPAEADAVAARARAYFGETMWSAVCEAPI
jgi:4-diphosphocytidyl-2-C-methyl-D-erythritol kinase